MIEGLKPHSAYKDSGLPWLGEIPGHWEVRRNGRLFAERTETGFPDLPILEVSLKTGVRVRDFDTSLRKQVMADKDKYKRACQGDIAYNMMRMWQGAVGVAPVDGLISPAYVVARPFADTITEYFAYLFRTDAYKGEINNFSRGIVSDRNRLYWEEFKQIPTPFPPAAEQSAIVRFLDHADRRIRRYIGAKRRLIALLNEQKQAIIHRAVTRGFNPNVCLKPSGIEWLGEMPEHWNLKRFKFLTRITSGQVDPRQSPYRDMVLVAPNHIESGSGRIREERTAAEQGADSGKYLVSEGQVIYSKIRPNLRKAAIALRDCLCSADMYPISPSKSEFVSEYFVQLLLSKPFTKYAVDCSMRVAMPKINREALGECWLWYPSVCEQRQILDFIAESSLPLDIALDAVRREIDLVLEYRTRLISDVVTGRVDVREVVKQLPPEINELDNNGDLCELSDDEPIDDADLDAEPVEVEA